MQHDHVLKKLNFDLILGGGGGGGGGGGMGICGQNIYNHSSAFVIRFYLICKISGTMLLHS